MKQPHITIVGGGVMGETIIASLILARLTAPKNIAVVEHNPQRARHLAKLYHSKAISSYKNLSVADVIILAVKPQDANAMCEQLRPHLKPTTLIISIMAGISLAKLTRLLRHKRIIRSMPNTPARVRCGMTVWLATKQVTSAQKSVARKIFEAFGTQMEVNKEDLINVATAVSGSGPAYVFAFVEYLISAAQHLGLTDQQAELLVKQTLKGATELLFASNEQASELRRRVTSKGGTTEAALQIFQNKKTAAIYQEALRAAYRRSQQLSQSV